MQNAAFYYEHGILKRPALTIFVLLLVIAFIGFHSTQFRLDASADTLVLENDKSLQFYRNIKARYGSDDFLIVTFSPHQDLFSESVLNTLQSLQTELSAIEGIASTTSILNAPLVNQPGTNLESIRHHVVTLSSPDVDKALAKEEFLASPIYQELLISNDARTTALQLNIRRDKKYERLLKERDSLREQQLVAELTPQQAERLASISTAFYQHSAQLQSQLAEMIEKVRNTLRPYKKDAELFLGGVPMITADSIDFIADDLAVFGLGVFIFLIVTLVFAFKKPRWVVLPLLTCFASGLVMLGLLGLLDWPVTVVSANFISLMLIITLSLTIHLIVRYQELHNEFPNAEQSWLVATTIKKKFLPCLYTAVTTMVAFGSLLLSFIRPVIDFGWMMTIGVAVAFIFSFTLFPALLLLFKPGQPQSPKNFTGLFTRAISKKIEAFPRVVWVCFTFLLMVSIWGVTQLTVENRFIDYYKSDTEIYQGMTLIDKKLGGTTPLDVIIDAPNRFFQQPDEPEQMDSDILAELGMEVDESGSSFESEGGITSTSYWFNVEQLKQVDGIHKYLESLPETGKVLSIATTMAMLTPLDPVVASDNFYLAILYKSLPLEIKEALFAPYLAPQGNQIRFSIRVFESDANLQREQLLTKIRKDLQVQFGLSEEQIHLSGMLVMYNNMLQSLFKSQILTIGVVFLAIFIMFILLFKNWRLAAIAIAPNMIAAAMVLGLMGLMQIPLDLMTITIAAICIGIAVDNSIHYVHRFELEFAKEKSYWQCVRNCHASIGRAMYYTSLTITLGFSILALSKFVPTVYFGLLTGFAMMAALLANLTLLPVLIATLKPLGSSLDSGISKTAIGDDVTCQESASS